MHYRGQLIPGSRQTSSNSEGGVINQSSLDDSGVVDDHDDGGDLGAELLQAYHMDKLRNDMTPVTLALSPKEVRIIKCNGNVARLKKHNVYELHPEYLSQIVVLGSYTITILRHNSCSPYCPSVYVGAINNIILVNALHR